VAVEEIMQLLNQMGFVQDQGAARRKKMFHFLILSSIFSSYGMIVLLPGTGLYSAAFLTGAAYAPDVYAAPASAPDQPLYRCFPSI
jgi:hypothetical protein